MESIKMTVRQWSEVMSNPRQRDTELHAIKAAKKHLQKASPTHARVVACRLPGGALVKLDGHTRGLMWVDGRLDPPPVVYVDVISAKSMEEAKELYTHYDNASTTESATDRVFGAFREAGIEPKSGLVSSCLHTSALKHLSTPGATIYQAVKAWKREILLLDSIGAGHRAIGSGLFMGSLCVLRVRGERAIPFISAVIRDAGDRDERGSDGVDAIVRFAKERRRSNSESAIQDEASRFITAFEGWLVGRRFRQPVRPTGYMGYLDRGIG